MSIFNTFGEHQTTISIRSGVDLPTGVVLVESGTKELGRIEEVDAGDHGGEVGELAYFGYREDGGQVSGLADFEEALATIIASADLS
jgi:hypothetical protein